MLESQGGLGKTVKMVTIPVERNKILLRVENLADSGANAMVNLDTISQVLAWAANL